MTERPPASEVYSGWRRFAGATVIALGAIGLAGCSDSPDCGGKLKPGITKLIPVGQDRSEWAFYNPQYKRVVIQDAPILGNKFGMLSATEPHVDIGDVRLYIAEGEIGETDVTISCLPLDKS